MASQPHRAPDFTLVSLLLFIAVLLQLVGCQIENSGGHSTVVKSQVEEEEGAHLEDAEAGRSFRSRSHLSASSPSLEWERSFHMGFNPFKSRSKAKAYYYPPPQQPYLPPNHYEPVKSPSKAYGVPPSLPSPPLPEPLLPPISPPPSPPLPCSAVFQAPSFIMQSPLYPQPYPPNSQCFYTVRRQGPNTCSVELQFRHFYLEPIPQCLNDWLRIGDRRYCGQQPQRTVVVPFGYGAAELVFHFRADSGRQFPGFYILGRQIPCPHPLPPPPQQPPRPPLPPPVYPPVTPPPRPPLPPPTFTPRPPFPPLPPPTFTPPIVTPTPPTFPPTQPPTRPCDSDFRVPQGRFESPNYPHNYAPNLACNLRFIPPAGYCTLEISFQDFQLEDSPGCSKDALIVGRNRYCASSLYGQRLRISFPPRTALAIQFTTDLTVEQKGYSAIYRMIECELLPTTTPSFTTPPGVTCDRVFQDVESFITSVNFPLAYPKNLDCIYRIDKAFPTVSELEIYFVAFDVQESADCQADSVEIDNQLYCGEQTGRTLRVPFIREFFEMRFHSDLSIENTGFNIRVRQLDLQNPTTPLPSTPTPTQCGNQIFGESSFLLISPQFPQPYLPGQECTYTILKSSQDVCQLQLKFTVFSLPGSPNNCQGDFLEGGGNRYCGDLSGQSSRIFFLESQIVLTFRSDLINDPAEGFSIQVVQLTECSVLPGFGPPLLKLVESPRIPEPEPAGCRIGVSPLGQRVDSTDLVSVYELDEEKLQSCAYHISPEPDACGVQLQFHQFYITPSTNCSEDYIEIENRRFCGQQLDNIKIDVGYTVGDVPIRMPFHMTPQRKYQWNFTTSPINCDSLGMQCTKSVWKSSGTFEYRQSAVSRSLDRTTVGQRQCDFVIRRWSRRICRLEVEFQRFQIGTGLASNCSLNHMDIGGQDFCGNLSGRKMSLEFPPSEESIRIPLTHQDDVDLMMNVKQIQCRRKR